MSTLIDQARRVPRIAEAAVERARLTVVPRTPSRRRAARMPFVVLVSMLLVGGVVGLLFFNTSMQQTSFRVTSLEDRAEELQAQSQGLQLDLEELRNPQRVALQAKAMGMVPGGAPAFVRLSDGTVIGTPEPARADTGMRVLPLPTPKPRNLTPKPLVITPAVGTRNGQPAGSQASDGAASATVTARRGTTATGTTETQSRQQGSDR
jgi:hypothetical protein